MRLPKETLLDIVSCVDYASLVALCFANSRIRRVIEGNEEILAARRTFHLKVSQRLILVEEQLEGKCALVTKKTCILDNYNEAMREVETILRGHPVSNLELHRPLSLSELLDLLPQLAYTKTLFIRRFDSLEGIVDEYIRPLSHLTNLRLGYHYDGFPSKILEILGEDLLLQIPSITFRIGSFPAIDEALEDLFYRFCFDFSGLERDSKKFVAVHGAYLSNELCRRIVKGVENSSRPITVKFGCKLSTQIVADAFVNYIGEAVRYVSRHTGLVVIYMRLYVTVTNVDEDACEALKGGPF